MNTINWNEKKGELLKIVTQMFVLLCMLLQKLQAVNHEEYDTPLPDGRRFQWLKILSEQQTINMRSN